MVQLIDMDTARCTANNRDNKDNNVAFMQLFQTFATDSDMTPPLRNNTPAEQHLQEAFEKEDYAAIRKHLANRQDAWHQTHGMLSYREPDANMFNKQEFAFIGPGTLGFGLAAKLCGKASARYLPVLGSAGQQDSDLGLQLKYSSCAVPGPGGSTYLYKFRRIVLASPVTGPPPVMDNPQYYEWEPSTAKLQSNTINVFVDKKVAAYFFHDPERYRSTATAGVKRCASGAYAAAGIVLVVLVLCIVPDIL